jgi:uncharacterized membrane protein YhaH (DUF805 family)
MLMFQPYRRYADFEGRSRRSEFWLFHLFLWLVVIGFVITGGIIALIRSSGGQLVGGILGAINGLTFFAIFLGSIVPSFALTVRRLHDSDKSGFWLFLAFLPFLGGLVLFVFYVLDGTPGRNRYGDDPKGRASSSYAETFS